MPSHKAKAKSLRQDVKLNEYNSSVRAGLRTLVKKVRLAVQEENKDLAIERFRTAASALDTAGKRHIIHPNNASRRKSRLAAMINKLNASSVASDNASE